MLSVPRAPLLRETLGRLASARKMAFSVVPDDQGTLATFDYRYVPRGGPIGRFTGPLIDKMLTATFTEMLAATEEAALANGGER
jgi:hypothetical protein